MTCKWIEFFYEGKTVSGKTDLWSVLTIEDRIFVGVIRWWGKWRKYVFVPQPNTLFEQVCLRDIADFCERVTREKREARKGGVS